ncbi:ABC transporter substrate-binding protein [Aquibium microcysteis]|uniref:ABC transporter substrate-binding protein n=1 Tax=Aquibium microcysteis TaxID=675281 RepID=UPI00165D026E|nr:ABC transporter substrate-binding protein [Aquibium microcysteis]
MKHTWFASAALLALALATPASAQLKFAPGEDDRFNWEDYENLQKIDLKGQTLSVFGPWRGEDEALVRSVLAYFSEATGVDLTYSSSENYEQQIVIDTQAGSPPNVAVLPQPGLIQDLASKGLLTPLGEDAAAFVRDNYGAGQSWVDLGTFRGADGEEHFYGFPYKADLKSLVWYVPENFEEAGYEVPTTWDELMALQKQIVEDGGTPWCIGLGSGGATGWPATDWVEDIMLRTQPPEVYDQWTSNGIPFTDERVVGAMQIFADIATVGENVSGGAAAVAATDFRDSPKGLFDLPPKCYMHRQASFISSFFPDGTEIGLDADFFYLPEMTDKNLGKPVLGGGTLFTITRDSPAAQAFIDFLQTPLAHEIWMAQSGFLTPLKTANPEAYANEALKKQGDILVNADTFRFDGSDLMPGKIGAGAFWTGMIDLVGGKPADQVAAEIQSAWDAIK